MPQVHSRARRIHHKGAKLAALAFLAALVYGLGLWVLAPDVSYLERETPRQTRYMRLRAEALGLPASAFEAQATPLDVISPLLVCSVIRAEDPRFFRHHGVEWAAFRNATVAWLRGRARRGGSTITQQLARNLYLHPGRTVHRKLREVVIARKLEDALPKRRILELYLATVEWGDGVWGVANASQRYFAKPPSGLDAFEASFLVGLLPAPRSTLEGGNAARMRAVQLRVLKQLHLAVLLDAQAYARARSQVEVLHSRLEQRAPLEEALAAAGRVPAPDRSASSMPTLEAMLERECGLSREDAAQESSPHP